jgi:hypothetical protein
MYKMVPKLSSNPSVGIKHKITLLLLGAFYLNTVNLSAAFLILRKVVFYKSVKPCLLCFWYYANKYEKNFNN